MAEPSLPELEALRDRLYARLATVGDFRRGSVSVNYRRCGKPNCACADQDHPGHGPRFLWDPVELEHAVGDDEAAHRVAGGGDDCNRTQHSRERALVLTRENDGADHRDRVEGVSQRHQRCVQQRRYSADHFKSDKCREYENVQAVDQVSLDH